MAEEVQQIKSKERVRARGEVFTAPREVNAMLDLVKQETESIDSTFLEPACGDGNFLDEVLRRKLAVCLKTYHKSPTDYEKFSFLACTTLYGVDIMADNVAKCRERLFETWEASFTPSMRSDFHDRVTRAVKVVFEKNILLGNALSMKRVDEHQNDLKEPIMFMEWKPSIGDTFTRREFRFDILLDCSEEKTGTIRGLKTRYRTQQQSTFDLFGESSAESNWMVDPDDPKGEKMIPAPSKILPSIEYWRIGDE